MKKSEEILKKIDEVVEQPFVTATFGDGWKEHAEKYYPKDILINIA